MPRFNSLSLTLRDVEKNVASGTLPPKGGNATKLHANPQLSEIAKNTVSNMRLTNGMEPQNSHEGCLKAD